MKIKILVLIIITSFTLVSAADYVAMKSGKIYITKGKIEVKDNFAIFKIKGSDLQIKIPISKIDVERTKKLNTPKKKKTSIKKSSVKTFTDKDIKSTRTIGTYTDILDDGDEEEEEEVDPNAPPWETINEELFTIPDYSREEIELEENDWWQAEVGNVQNRFLEAATYQRKVIRIYNDLIVDYNSAQGKEDA